MYVLVAKITFDLGDIEPDRGFYRHLGAKIRARHRVCAYIYSEGEQAVLALTALARQRDVLSLQYERICALCEQEGLGRVFSTDGEPLIVSIDRLC